MASNSRQPTAVAKKLILRPMLTLKGHKHAIPSVSYFMGGKRMIGGSYDKTIRQWDLEAGKEIEEARDVCEQGVRAVGASRDGRWVVTACGNSDTRDSEFRSIRVCEVETGTVRIFQGTSRRITCIDISVDNTLLASGSWDGTVQIWSLETGKLAVGPFKSAHQVNTVRFSQNLKKLAVKSWLENTLEVWDVATQSLDLRVKKPGGVGISSTPVFWTIKDQTIVTAFSIAHHSVYEFDVTTLETVGSPFKGHTNVISGLALSLDCALLASASDDNTIKLWAFGSRQLLASFYVLSTIHHLILSPDSHQLVYTTLDDTNIYLCNTPPEILASIRPVPQSGAHSLTAYRSTRAAPLNAQRSLVSHSLPRPISSARHRIGSKFWTDRHAGTSHIQPTDIRLFSDVWRWSIPPSQIPSSTILSWLPRFRPDPCQCKLLLSSSHTHSVFSARNDELDGLPTEVMLPDLSKYITKDGHYPVARGGFGEIWKCTLRTSWRSTKVAVKALQVYAADQLGAAKAKKIKRIKRELRICAKLKHANILPVYGYTHGFGPFLAIVSPWVENGNLSDYLELEGAALTLVRRFEILRDIIAGLQYLHTNSIIHGDFNGPNVLIHGDGTACVADFGLSLMYSEVISPSQASWTSTLKGNMRWMAPELLVPEQEDGSPTRPSEHSDVFSFGGIVLQVLTNKIPYYYLPNDAAIVLCIARSEKPSRTRYPELPEKYWTFIEQCWSTDPQDRPSTEGADVTIRNEFDALSRSR